MIKAIKDKSIEASSFWNMSHDERNVIIYDKTYNFKLENVLKESKKVFISLIKIIEE